MNGAQYIVDFLNKKNIEVCFGYPGGGVLPLYHALVDAKFTHVLTRHEQGAIHAAEGYARANGKVGVVIATSGPGATNLVTGIANAFLDSTPILAITGQVVSNFLGKDSFQEADITGITMPITKHNFLVKNILDLPSALNDAWDTTTQGRHGPVLIDVTKDVFNAELPKGISSSYKHAIKSTGIQDEDLNKLIELLKDSKRPLIMAGGGVVTSKGANDLLTQIAHEYKIPVVTTLMGKGAISEKSEYCLGTIGMHGLPTANMALCNADLLIAIGVRFSDRVAGNSAGFAGNKKIVHIDIDSAELNKNVVTDLAIISDSKDFLKVLIYKLNENIEKDKWEEWLVETKKNMVLYPMDYEMGTSLKPQYVIEQVTNRLSADSPIVTDVGQHQMFAAQYAKIRKPRRFITSGGLGTMGFGLPASIGAALAVKDVPTVLFVGDGGVQMTIQELATIAKLNLPIKVFIMDNSCLGMVRQWQELFFDKRYSESILNDNPDFVAIAHAYGLKSELINNREEFDRKIDDIINSSEPVVIHCKIDAEENVFPMIPPGKNPDDMMDKKGERYMKCSAND